MGLSGANEDQADSCERIRVFVAFTMVLSLKAPQHFMVQSECFKRRRGLLLVF
jgi:hypothetical protein